MPIRGSPNGARHLHPQAGRNRLERVVAINRNVWSRSIGIAGRDHSVRAVSQVNWRVHRYPRRGSGLEYRSPKNFESCRLNLRPYRHRMGPWRRYRQSRI